MGLSVLSCSKDDNAGKDSGFVINNYQLITLSNSKAYSKDVYTPTYDSRGRVVKSVYETYSSAKGKNELLTVEIRDFDYKTSTAYATYCMEILTPGALYVTGPDTLSLKFGDGLKLKKATKPDYSYDYTYDGDHLESYSVAIAENDPTVRKYIWSGGDLASMLGENGKAQFNVTYGEEANPFVNTIDPLLAIYSSIIPDYACANLIGKNSAHLPVSYQEDFYGDTTFSFEYTRDDKGRIVRVDITGDDPDVDYGKTLLISYSSL